MPDETPSSQSRVMSQKQECNIIPFPTLSDPNDTDDKEIEEFSRAVANGLRAPLRHVRYFAELLQKKAFLQLNETDRRYLAILSREASRIAEGIDALRAFSRVGCTEMQKSPVALRRVVIELVAERRAELAHRQIDWIIGELPTVIGDRALLRQALANLLANATKFTHNRKIALIEIGCLPKHPAETVIFVKDNGVGFEPKYAHKLFGIFERLHSIEEFEGVGIGLAVVRRIISRHGGRTWAEGTTDAGATFYFSIPDPTLSP